MPNQNPWTRRLRRLVVVGTTASTIYLVSSYVLDQLHQNRVRALRERQERVLLKNHFTSLLSTISFTLYALLPTLQSQIYDAYPVESTSQALQALSSSTLSSSQASIEPTPEHSMLLHGHTEDPVSSDGATSLTKSGNDVEGVEESWASEFRRQDVDAEPSLPGSTIVSGAETDDAVSSTFSQSISLPPTDTSSISPSPESDLSHHAQLLPSPPRVQGARPGFENETGKSKKELWRDLKVQTLTRSFTTAYLVSLLYLLTSSQLSILARLRYLSDVKSTIPSPTPRPARPQTGCGWPNPLSMASWGLSKFGDSTASFLPSIPFLSQQTNPAMVIVDDVRAEVEAQRAEAERVFLTYSWWVLHEGWKGVAGRVESAVERVFGGIALKRELSVEDWDGLVRDARASVESEIPDAKIELYDFTPHLIPSVPLPFTTSDCPLPSDLSSAHPHLLLLLSETNDHLSSPDSRYLLDKAVSAMLNKLQDELDLSEGRGKRLVDCLPVIDRWGKGVWENVPDTGAEAVLALPDFESFAALVFGDWAPRD
ncbi:MAG: peroxin [Tremellales sp. Tagirdzhanova-0007]|nr:MAG: peroxin [Tremellales sp. Tagirdzhanova-0007]